MRNLEKFSIKVRDLITENNFGMVIPATYATTISHNEEETQSTFDVHIGTLGEDMDIKYRITIEQI